MTRFSLDSRSGGSGNGDKTTSPAPASSASAREASGDCQDLVGLLGESRATIVRLLKTDGERSAPELAEALGISDVAVRKHLQTLAESGIITERTVKQERGRPVARYRLTPRGESLFPHRYVGMVDDLIDFLNDENGRAGWRAFLRWRQAREADSYAARVRSDALRDRLRELSRALEEAGYEAKVTETEDGFELTQTHCAIYEIAQEHPEMCAHEAAVFRRVLGDDVRLSRRATLADGASACVCTVQSVTEC